MRIAVCIPSYNEADSIAHVVGEVDRGLDATFDRRRCTIVNTDSGSTDETRSVFLETPTRCPKLSFDLSDEPVGKGRNLLHFLQWSIENDVDFLVTIDADITSIDRDWVTELSSPLMQGQADFVVPLYQRNRFEAITTNHFAYPLVYGYFGVDLRQPIGGEFGLSRETAKYILERPPNDPTIYRYGVDIFMSMHVLGAGLRVTPVSLGRKIHKPTLPKMSRVFKDVAAAAITVTRDYAFSPTLDDQSDAFITIDDDTAFPHGESSQAMVSEAQQKALEFIPLYEEWSGVHGQDLEASISSERPSLNAERWTELLAGCVAAAVSDKTKARDLADQILPAFLIRAVSFWTEIDGLTAEAVDEMLLAQARMLRGKLAERALAA